MKVGDASGDCPKMVEIWKSVKGYEDEYMVSNRGNLYSVKRKMLLSNVLDKYNYHIVCLCKNGKARNYKVHRLVAIAFIPNPENKATVNHINGIKTDNMMENLEWATVAEQNRHKIDVLHKATLPEAHRKPIILIKDSIEYPFESTTDAYKAMGFNIISRLKSGEEVKGYKIKTTAII